MKRRGLYTCEGGLVSLVKRKPLALASGRDRQGQRVQKTTLERTLNSWAL